MHLVPHEWEDAWRSFGVSCLSSEVSSRLVAWKDPQLAGRGATGVFSWFWNCQFELTACPAVLVGDLSEVMPAVMRYCYLLVRSEQ